jgi:penicillin-binding protein 1A
MTPRFLYAVAAVVVASAAGGGLLTATVTDDCPPVAALKTYRPPEASRVFTEDGQLLADLSPQRRIVVELDRIPAIVRDGFIAVEDRRFWEHDGVDYRGVARAIWRDLTSLSLKEGFSTIPMQLARNVFPEQLPRGKKFSRKICEVRLARQIEDEFSKREILELYLNQIYLGDGLYGVEAAAQGYFGKEVARLTPAQAALLVALVRSPEGYNPRKHPMTAIQRRNVVLGVLAREGVLTEAEAERAKREPLRLAPPLEAAGRAPYAVAAVRRELRERFGPDADIQGLRVYTSLDPALQQAAREALVGQIERIESGAYGRYRHSRPAAGAAEPDSAASPYLQGMIIALDPHDGRIRALVGGRDFALSQFDRALQARRQPGSAFKPIVYAAALQQRIPPTTRIDASPVNIDNAGSPVWQPADHLADSMSTITLRDALALSSNNATVRLGQWIGVQRVIDMARALGLTTAIPPYPSISIGSAEVVPAELVAAYAAFANGGYRVEPHLITRVEDAHGNLLWQRPFERRRVLEEGVAFLTLSLMEDVIERGTGGAVRRLGFWLPAAGKTGTTNQSKDAWFIGMTPDLVAGVWIGFDRPQRIVANGSGGSLAAPAWAEFMKAAYSARPAPAAWVPPPSVTSIPVDLATGSLATHHCPAEQVRIEYFLPGTEPREYCPLHPESGAERFFRRLWEGVRGIF